MCKCVTKYKDDGHVSSCQVPVDVYLTVTNAHNKTVPPILRCRRHAQSRAAAMTTGTMGMFFCQKSHRKAYRLSDDVPGYSAMLFNAFFNLIQKDAKWYGKGNTSLGMDSKEVLTFTF